MTMPRLNERPEALDGLSVDRTANVLAASMVNGRVRVFSVQPPVASRIGLCKAG